MSDSQRDGEAVPEMVLPADASVSTPKEEEQSDEGEVYQRTQSVAGMMTMEDAEVLNVDLDDLLGHRGSLKLLITRLASLEAEARELRESNAVLSSQLGTLRVAHAKREGELRGARSDLARQKQASLVRDVVGGFGLALLSAGISLVPSDNQLIGWLMSGIGAVLVLIGFLVAKKLKNAGDA